MDERMGWNGLIDAFGLATLICLVKMKEIAPTNDETEIRSLQLPSRLLVSGKCTAQGVVGEAASTGSGGAEAGRWRLADGEREPVYSTIRPLLPLVSSSFDLR